MNRLFTWYIKRRLLHVVRRIRKEEGVMNLIGRIIGLDFPFLVGIRTKLGLAAMFAQPVLDAFTDGAVCAQFPRTCSIVQGLSKWLIVAGIYGKAK